MSTIRKKIVTDENKKPIAVQIDYGDWLKIERMLEHKVAKAPQLARFRGVIRLSEDPLTYQRRIREEWK